MSESQKCFVIGGFMLCNFVIRNGVEIRSKSGKNLKFPIKWGSAKRREVGVTQTATTSEKQ